VLHTNGVDATTGEPLLPPLTEQDVADAFGAIPLDRASVTALTARHRRTTESHLAPKHGVDGSDLASSGWGIISAEGADPAVLLALRPLLEHRREQAASASEGRFREFSGVNGYRQGESKQEFQARLGAGPGPVDPDVLPYHLLIVGGPEEVPFPFQYQLDVQHSVGRVSFATTSEYAIYAENVVGHESATGSAPVDACFFAPRNDGDKATGLSEQHLARPLAESFEREHELFRVSRLLGRDATKAGLLSLLGGPSPPRLLFSASHGLGFPSGHPEQPGGQGALVCQDWGGPGHGPLSSDQWFGAADVRESEADLTGMVAFLFACFGAGTPRDNDFGRAHFSAGPLAPAPFVAALPRALLGREGGALAVVGHVDRAWAYSFMWPGAGAQTEVFHSSLRALGSGELLGAALEFMGDRHAEVATELAQTLELRDLGKRIDPATLVALWTAYADTRNYILLGDPAVRIRQRVVPPSPARPTMAVTGGAVLSRQSTRPETVEVATYVTDDPSSVDVDPTSGRITGARLALYSVVHMDGDAQHVVTTPLPGAGAEARTSLLTDIHSRLLDVSLSAQRAAVAEGNEPHD
jgi:hypothetical protein